MLPNNKSFWARITGLSDEELGSDSWDGSKFKKPKEEISRPSKQNPKEFLSVLEGNNQKQIEPDVSEENLELWQGEQEGQLAIDVYQTPKEVIIKSAIAGVKIGDLDITVDNDIVTIRGERKDEQETGGENYFYQECYWGKFSRSVVLPCEVKKDKAKANLKDGVLIIVLPKTESAETTKVKVKEKK